MKRYRGAIADSIRWQTFVLRDDDVIITTPSKCGTTWMQTIVGMLLFGRVDLGMPLGRVSPWLDMLTRSTDDVFGLLDAQEHRRFIKTHTPMDGLPQHDSVTYIAVVRHPLDAALSNRDHSANAAEERIVELRTAAMGGDPLPDFPPLERPDDAAEYLRWWIDADYPATGTGANTLADLVYQATTYWEARDRPNVHLFHYADLESDLDGEMRRVAGALGTEVDAATWPDLVRAATFDAMRARAPQLAPEAHLGFWNSVDDFFKVGGRRKWTDLLLHADLAHYEERLADLSVPDAVAWISQGRRALR